MREFSSVEKQGQTFTAPAQAPRWPGTEHLLPLLVNILLLLWWVGLLHVPGLGHIRLRGEDAVMTAAPIWTELFGVIFFYLLALVAEELSGVLWPYAVRARAALRMAVAAFGLWLTWIILNAGHWFTLLRGDDSARVEGGLYLITRDSFRHFESWRDLAGFAANLSVIASWILVCIAAGLVFKIFGAVWKLNAAESYRQ